MKRDDRDDVNSRDSAPCRGGRSSVFDEKRSILDLRSIHVPAAFGNPIPASQRGVVQQMRLLCKALLPWTATAYVGQRL